MPPPNPFLPKNFDIEGNKIPDDKKQQYP